MRSVVLLVVSVLSIAGGLFSRDGAMLMPALPPAIEEGGAVPGCGPPDASGKVVICHVPPGQGGQGHEIEVGTSALTAHLAHGDTCGDCNQSDGNEPPLAHAGMDQTIMLGSVAHLDGSGSTDADGDPLTFSWSFVALPLSSQATLDDPSSVMPTFVVDVPGSYAVQLIVHDGAAASAPDVVTVTTLNSPPVADAGPDQTTAAGTVVQLDGSNSTDVDGDRLSYTWSLLMIPPGSSASLSDPTAVTPTLSVDLPGTYQVQLVVNDGLADSAPDTVTVTTSNTAPVADAGPDQTVSVGATVELDGGGSSDFDGDPLSFSWSLTAAPAGSQASLSAADTVTPTLVVDVAGVYVVQLVVNDGLVDSVPDTVMLLTSNSPPTADAGPDQSVNVGDAVQLDGSGSGDADGDPLTFMWSLTTVPAESQAVLSDPGASAPTFDVDVAGSYVAQLVVNDGTADSDPDTVLITTLNAPPVADAGPDQAVLAGDQVQLDGSGSSDPDDDPVTYRWSLLSRPSGSQAALSDPAAVMPAFVADLAGTYVAQLIVNDAELSSAPDSVTVVASAGGATLVNNPSSMIAVELGGTQQLRVFMVEDGTIIEVTGEPQTSFLSLAPTIVAIDDEGTMTFLEAGDAQIMTSFQGLAATTMVTVDPDGLVMIEAALGSAGGELLLDDGTGIVVPPGALGGTEMVAVEEVELSPTTVFPAGSVQVSSAYVFAPGIAFSVPVRISIGFDPDEVPSAFDADSVLIHEVLADGSLGVTGLSVEALEESVGQSLSDSGRIVSKTDGAPGGYLGTTSLEGTPPTAFRCHAALAALSPTEVVLTASDATSLKVLQSEKPSKPGPGTDMSWGIPGCDDNGDGVDDFYDFKSRVLPGRPVCGGDIGRPCINNSCFECSGSGMACNPGLQETGCPATEQCVASAQVCALPTACNGHHVCAGTSTACNPRGIPTGCAPGVSCRPDPGLDEDVAIPPLQEVEHIVLHSTNGVNHRFRGEVDWADSPRSLYWAQYYVGKDGTIAQVSQDSMSTNHVAPGMGVSNANAIGIEIFNNVGVSDYPGRQVAAVTRLVDFLLRQHPAVVRPGEDPMNPTGNIITHYAQDARGKCSGSNTGCDFFMPNSCPATQSCIKRKTDPSGDFRAETMAVSLEEVVQRALRQDVNSTGVINAKGGDAFGDAGAGWGGRVHMQAGYSDGTTFPNPFEDRETLVVNGVDSLTQSSMQLMHLIVTGTLVVPSDTTLDLDGILYVGPEGTLDLRGLTSQDASSLDILADGFALIEGRVLINGYDARQPTELPPFDTLPIGDGSGRGGDGGDFTYRSAASGFMWVPTIVTRGGDADIAPANGGDGGEVTITGHDTVTDHVLMRFGGRQNAPLCPTAATPCSEDQHEVGLPDYMPPPAPFNWMPVTAPLPTPSGLCPAPIGAATNSPSPYYLRPVTNERLGLGRVIDGTGDRLPGSNVSRFDRGIITVGGTGGVLTADPSVGGEGGFGGAITVSAPAAGQSRVRFCQGTGPTCEGSVQLFSGAGAEAMASVVFVAAGGCGNFKYFEVPTGSTGGRGASLGGNGGFGGSAGQIAVSGILFPDTSADTPGATGVEQVRGYDGDNANFTSGNPIGTVQFFDTVGLATSSVRGSGGSPGGHPSSFPGAFGFAGLDGTTTINGTLVYPTASPGVPVMRRSVDD